MKVYSQQNKFINDATHLLLYKKFRNIQRQEVSLSDKFKCSYKDGRLLIEMSTDNSMADYIYENDFMRSLRIIVGKTGSGKTNFLQMIGVSTQIRAQF